jgi:thymidine kinase
VIVRLPASTGWVEIVTGGMFSGKTEELIRRLRRAMIARQRVASFKPIIDDRYSAEDIVSHGGVTLTSRPISDPKDILGLVDGVEVVGFDEAQFFSDEIVDVVQEVARGGRRVIIAGLDMDYRGVPFGPVPNLLAVAERVDKLHAVCTICGSAATRSQRIVDSEDQVVVGGVSVYEARCRTHWKPQPTFSARRQMAELED